MNKFFSLRQASLRTMALASGLILGLGACDVTDLRPQDALSEDVVYGDPARVALAVTGVYNAAQSGFYDALTGGALQVRGYPFGAAASILDDVRGEDVVDMAGFFGIVYTNAITPASPNIVNMWSGCYAVILQANVTMAGVRSAASRGVISAADATVYEGEMLFLRALAHHQLVINFSRPFTQDNGASPGIPYRTVAVNTEQGIDEQRALGRGTVAEVYTKMLADLDEAEAKLPATRTGNLRATRATKGAAIALKQRLRLYQGNWQAAVTEGNKLITGTATFTSPIGTYALMPTPQEAFPGGTTVTAENIFSIENSADDTPGVNGALPSIFGSRVIGQNTAGAGRALVAISPILFNAPFFTCNDLRRTQLMQLDNGSQPRYVTRKYKDPAAGSDFAPIIRYAEVLLNQAEALARLGTDNTRALALLNAVRNRAVTTASERFAAGSLMGPALVQAVLNERRIELVAEGFRWDDIHRLSGEMTYSPRPGGGIPAKYATVQVGAAAYGCNQPLAARQQADVAANATLFLWPIPALETANNPTLLAQQNPGY